ncbi:membrane-anchored ubiquitin-fold protein 1 isoform X1 [Elaeis guineensis]|uniref:Membrane-anchored ubiquitin-fold protein n=1 Tax=Elaeis guineensis var. tenera TaxID=51953 RepID=A0A8N4IBV3_ELAGV|nr:membrane-anchored ubiquitin-fold protein 1 isoform X1 [Elaeis guineensis]XP_029123672.1 membrane-anchored ubiquitin-fold protein 1 isoform X1 [Elaeis guineensis]
MSGVQEPLEIKFRLFDGSDIGPKKYAPATSVATLKESIIAQWPKVLLIQNSSTKWCLMTGKENGPRTVNDLKLINAGKILENNRTLADCRSPMYEFSGVTTMHVVVRPPSSERGTEKKVLSKPKENKCGCSIL